MAYYMFVNHGWRPQQVADLLDREKILMIQMALKEINSRPKVGQGHGGYTGST